MSAVYTQREADEAQIKQQVARIAEGIRAKDLEGLRPIYATDVVSFDVAPPLQHVGVEAKLKNWANVQWTRASPTWSAVGCRSNWRCSAALGRPSSPPWCPPEAASAWFPTASSRPRPSSAPQGSAF